MAVCRDLQKLPKAHLHLHLEGAMRLSTLRDLCTKHCIQMPSIPEPADDGTYEGFGPFKDLYLAAVDALRSSEDLARVVREVVEDAQKEGVRWLELHFYPGFESYQKRIGTKEEVWEIARTSAAAASTAYGVGVGFIAATERWLPVPDAVETAEIAVRLSNHTHSTSGEALAPIVALGLQGPEEGFPPEPFHEAFSIARKAGLVSVPHAGEHSGPESVRGSLDALGAQRLAHGVRAIEDPELVTRLSAEGICCDTCPSSNVMLRVVPSLEMHPLVRLIAAGVSCTVNADDPLLFRGITILDEYIALREKVGMNDKQIADIARTSFCCSACPHKEIVSASLKGIDEWLLDEQVS